jgi:hypothetical protein
MAPSVDAAIDRWLHREGNINQRRLALLLAVGLLVALSATACGVAYGQVPFAPGGPAILNPVLNGFHLPPIFGSPHLQAASHSMAHPHAVNSVSQAELAAYSHNWGCHTSEDGLP